MKQLSQKTLSKNKIYTIEITGLTHEGQGVGKLDGFVVFVNGTLIGEIVDIKIIKQTKSYAVGSVVRIQKSSDKRIEPFCPAFDKCGGCSIQHMSYDAQLEFKTDNVRQNLRRIGGLDNVQVNNTIGMEHPFQYRNKVQYPVGTCGSDVVVGFYEKGSHNIVESKECNIQPPESNEIRDIVRDFFKTNGITIYNEKTGKGFLRHVMVRKGFKTNELMVVLVVNGKKVPKADQLVKLLCDRYENIKSIMVNVNTRNTNIILGDKNTCIYGQGYISDYIGKYKFNISPLSFFQVNPVQTEVLYNKALEYAGLTGNETVFDLYCGIGTISLFLSEKAKKVIGVEVVPDAIADAKRNAQLNGIENVEFLVGEAETVIPKLYEEGARADVVVVDPPRKGCEESLLKTLVDMQPQRIVYVSCNPSTLARDVKFLHENGFEVKHVQPVDMFPWSGHVESVVLIERK
ncbi:23S rRNA (uracil(1939)-C(5))-methyltransferase RlmD [Ruminiclostridium herbifermentans]|uniref:23S rRNA (Uracil(1939)-C(5))-methyltransferase RlmD n=1 Tax=Ruminiclostridium herbifermentans TaxID=2488810 RepID=A0A4U7J6Z2_9FIRM|nr:23S rRNA (uracil(1939)-C(5))-methyltransferase RlmD [Ruminiclostridium herbifermentans]QNU66559.1 23S rRNA (uracil(1939)-C(5))-methyltransferase RlmD [Ruminiclostridium herbifermentans]